MSNNTVKSLSVLQPTWQSPLPPPSPRLGHVDRADKADKTNKAKLNGLRPANRPGLLASVRDQDEAAMALQAGVDILDLKNPDAGALGALNQELIETICQQLKGQCLLSATIGDLPPNGKLIAKQTKAWLNTGVDMVKIGLFSGDYVERCLADLKPLAQSASLIAVLFADRFKHVQGIINLLAHCGFTGVMLDTADKSNGSLRQVWNDQQIADFVVWARQHNMLSGLAGSLSLDDIAPLCEIRPDYLGFRTALCEQQQRTCALSSRALNQVRQMLHQYRPTQPSRSPIASHTQP